MTHAINSFMAAKADFDALLAQVQALADDRFGVDPDAVKWSDVASVTEASRHLDCIPSHFSLRARS